MISHFPKFTTLDHYHLRSIKRTTSRFLPYSDFNATSLFAWNVDESAEISRLNRNLVIKLPDYLTGKPIYSVLGKWKIDNSLEALLEHADEINLVPAEVVERIKRPDRFLVHEDRDQFDYIYSVNQHVNLPGQEFKRRRWQVSNFQSTFGDRISINQIDFHNQHGTAKLKQIFDRWCADGQKAELETRTEGQAIDRLLGNAKYFNLFGLELFVDGEAIGFSIVEKVNRTFAIYHFQKTLKAFKYSDPYITQKTAELIQRHRCKLINWEQDLGIEGLRRQKLSYRPVKMLKKYTVTLAK